MTEPRQLTIRLKVNGFTIPVTINADDEPLYRDAAKNINTTIANYTQHFIQTKPMDEILMMAMIDIALHYEQERANHDIDVYNDVLSSLTKEVEDAL